MKKITTNAGRVRVIGNLIPDFGEVTSKEYYISRNVTHTQTETLKHLGDDRLIRKMVGSRITTTLTLEATKIEGKTYLFYVRVTPVNSDLALTGGTVDLRYGDDTYILTFNLQPVSGSNYAEAEDTITLEGEGDITIKAEFSSYMLFHSSETSTIIHLDQPMSHVGDGTANPWTTDLLYRGSIDRTYVNTNYTNTPCVIKGIPLTGDFKAILHMHIDTANATPTFGLSSTPEAMNPVLTIHNTDVEGTAISSIFPTRLQVETIEISRQGYLYTVKHGSDVVEKYIVNTNTVYVFINKSGNGSALLNSMDYLTE